MSLIAAVEGVVLSVLFTLMCRALYITRDTRNMAQLNCMKNIARVYRHGPTKKGLRGVDIYDQVRGMDKTFTHHTTTADGHESSVDKTTPFPIVLPAPGKAWACIQQYSLRSSRPRWGANVPVLVPGRPAI